MTKLLKKLHLFGIWKKLCHFLINWVFVGTGKLCCSAKRVLMGAMGCPVGKGSTIVGPVHIHGRATIGEQCWINRDITVHGNGSVIIGDNCDIAPDVSFLTGGHAIGPETRRAGDGETYTITLGRGCWIGARSTLARSVSLGDGCVVAACACVVQDVPANTMVGGVPAKVIRSLDQ